MTNSVCRRQQEVLVSVPPEPLGRLVENRHRDNDDQLRSAIRAAEQRHLGDLTVEREPSHQDQRDEGARG